MMIKCVDIMCCVLILCKMMYDLWKCLNSLGLQHFETLNVMQHVTYE